MIVYFCRHANAGKRLADAHRDEKRTLDAAGVVQCGAVGRALASLGVNVEAVISSPLKRATQTAMLIANEIGFEGKLLLDDALRPDADYRHFRELLRRHAKLDAIMVVGHKPSLPHFLVTCVSNGGAAAGLDMKKGGVAKVDWRGRRSQLDWLITPRIVEAIFGASYETSALRARPNVRRK